MEITCPYCEHKQQSSAQKGDLVRCESCHKPFEAGTKPRPRPAAAAPTQTQPAPARTRHRPAQDLEETQFGTGLMIASAVGGVGILVAIIGLITLLSSLFSDSKSGALAGLMVMMVGMGCVLAAQIARATMKTADYTRIIAQNSME